MRRLHLSIREQLLAALVICFVVVGGYGWLRFRPAQQAIKQLNEGARNTEQKMLTTRIPDEPVEDLARIGRELADLENAQELIRTQAEAMEQRLSPADARELIVRISQLAQESRVKIRSNDEFQYKAVHTQVVNPVKSSKSKKNKPATPATSMTASSKIPAAGHGWVERMGPGSLFQRPLRHLLLEGSFTAIHQFIYGLAELPYQVTVLRLNIGKSAAPSPPGYSQVLTADLILAL